MGEVKTEGIALLGMPDKTVTTLDDVVEQVNMTLSVYHFLVDVIVHTEAEDLRNHSAIALILSLATDRLQRLNNRVSEIERWQRKDGE